MSGIRRIRILHVAECVGGVDRYLYGLIKYMDHNKFENVVVLSQRYNKEKYIDVADYVEVLNIVHGMGIETLKSAKDIRNLIIKYDPDIVYAHSSVAGAITRIANIGLKSKCIYNPHGWSFNMQSNKQVIFTLLERIMSCFCDGIICISQAEKNSAKSKKICKENKLHLIDNGIDINRKPSKNRKELNIPENAFVVGMVGRICRQKAPDIFIKMAEQVKDAYFVIVGDVIEETNQERIKLEKLAQRIGVNLLITGWVENPLDYIGVFDIACLFSRWEGFGLVIPEYMLCGKPIVATKVDAIPYLIEDGENGILVEVDDYQNAAKAVMKLRENEELRNRIIKNNLENVRDKYDIRRVANETEKLVRKLL